MLKGVVKIYIHKGKRQYPSIPELQYPINMQRLAHHRNSGPLQTVTLSSKLALNPEGRVISSLTHSGPLNF